MQKKYIYGMRNDVEQCVGVLCIDPRILLYFSATVEYYSVHFNRHRLTQVHLENGRYIGERETVRVVLSLPGSVPLITLMAGRE